MELEWTDFTEEDYPVTTCEFDGLSASVRLCNTSKYSGWGNRRWLVKNKDGVTLGSGYTLGSHSARQMCAAVLGVWCDAVPAGSLARGMADWINPRAG